ncbi:MAG: efflux RND transporter periplasmic adaptor subunit [Sphingobacteriaceae bacterium]
MLSIIKRNGFNALQNLKVVLYISALSLLTQCKSKPAEQTKQNVASDGNTVSLTGAQLKNSAVETVQLSEKNMATVLKLNGKIDVPPQSLVSVSVPLGGYLKSTKLLPGMHVRKGEIIAIMEDPQYIQLQQDYLLAQSKLHYAELDYNRQRDLNKSQASSDKVTQQAQADMNSQRINMRALAQQLQLININPDQLSENNINKIATVRSQIDGFVSKVNVNIGKYVNPSDVMFELIDPTDIHLNLKVYERDISKLSIGQKLTAYTNSDLDKKFGGEIILISKNISSDGVSDVHCHFEKYDKSLLPGTYMNAEIETKTTRSYTVPEESVVNFEGKDYVFVQTEKHSFKIMPVTTGEKENGFIQIINHSDFARKSIVGKNAYTLLMKLKNTSDDE